MNNIDFSVSAKLKFAIYLFQTPNLKYILLQYTNLQYITAKIVAIIILLQYTNLQYIIAKKVAIIIFLQWYLTIT